MNDKFESQKEQLISIKQEISLLYQQVNYLLRNEKPLGLLDLDVLMNRTHTLYDQLCAINVGDDNLDEDLPFSTDNLSGLFGGLTEEETEETTSTEEAVEEEVPEEETIPDVVEEPIEIQPVETHVEVEEEQEIEPVEVPVEVEEEQVVEPIEVPMAVEDEQPIENEVAEAETSSEEKPLSDEFGLFFRFEEAPADESQEEEMQEEPENEGKVVHVMEEIPEEDIPERDRVYGDELVKDNPLVMPRLDEERMAEKEEIERQSSDGMSDVFGDDDAEFELSTSETLGEKMMGEDHSLAAKLQQNSVRDLKSVIGINDKFLFVNELFGGSMEKYNKSIENLNDLKTLNGAMIYLNELKIELQWNSSNEAYIKLKDLVSRKFE